MNSLIALVQVVLLDVVLSADNAIIVGALAAGLSPKFRQKAIVFGVGIAVVLRIVLSLGVVWILQIPAIMVFGGAALYWVAFKMWRDIKDDGEADGSGENAKKGFGAALVAIAMADLSMSLDNILAVAGAAGKHTVALVFGLALSIALMGIGASFVAKLIGRYRWIAYVGLVLIVLVATRMVWDGVHGLDPYL